MPSDGVSVLAFLLIAAFTIERVASGVCIFLRGSPKLDYEIMEEGKERTEAKRKCEYVHFAVSLLLTAIIILFLGEGMLLFDILSLRGKPGVPDIPAWLDHALLGVILVGGSEQMSGFLKMVGEYRPPEKEEPADKLKLTGTLRVVEEPGAKGE